MSTGPSLLLSAFAAVFVAEIAGDKSIYSIGAIAARHSWRVVLAGLVPAFAVKMLAAVMLGDVVARLPMGAIALVTAATFFAAALVLWRERNEAGSAPAPASSARGAWVAFSAIAFTEWGDPGQLAAAALVARFGSPLVVWCGAVGAMLAKAALALTVGVGLRQYVSGRVARYAACLMCLTLGTASAAQGLLLAASHRP